MNNRQNVSDDEFKIHASGWLQPVIDELLQRPIAPQRWRALSHKFHDVLNERAASLGSSSERELRIAARSAISLILNGLTVPARLFDPDDPKSPYARDYVLELVRARINNLVTEDLLGPGWRHSSELGGDPLFIADTQWQSDIEIESEIHRVLSDLRGDEQDLEILLGRYLGESWSDVAARLEKKEPAVRKAWSRLKQRLSKKIIK